MNLSIPDPPESLKGTIDYEVMLTLASVARSLNSIASQIDRLSKRINAVEHILIENNLGQSSTETMQ